MKKTFSANSIGRAAKLFGFIRSYVIAYGIPGWKSRLLKLYKPFVKQGMLCFDIGSHFGNRISIWRKLGAKVVAIEPQPGLYSFLSRRYSGDTNITLLQGVVSNEIGQVTFYHNTRNPSVSTTDRSWIEEKKADPLWGKYIWDEEFQVRSFTLDQLIAQFGMPDFCKIDVEGAELNVLSGLSTPLKCLSFEYITIDQDRSLKCIDRIEELGRYEYNWTFSEFSALRSPKWLSATEMKTAIRRMKDGTYSGDVYARMVTGNT